MLLQFTVALDPVTTEVGVALNVSAGGAAATVTVTDCEALPPAPVHVSVNVVFAVIAALVAVPLVARAPDHPPLAEQVVALDDDHDNTVVLPETTVAGDALNVTAGSGNTVTVAVCIAFPPAPVQERV